MDAARINAKIYAGRGKAALRLGYSFDVFRPVIASDPFTTKVLTLKAAFNAGDNSYLKPNLYGKPVWFGDFDASQTQPGDYLVKSGSSQIYFIAAQQSLLPIACVGCDRSVRISSPSSLSGTGGGFVGYSGQCEAAGDMVDLLGASSANSGGFVGWPCSITLGPRGTELRQALPSGVARQTGWQILLPPSVPISLGAGSHVFDDLGRSYVIAGAELSDLGWRIQATELHA
jgi:hypothetical protein